MEESRLYRLLRPLIPKPLRPLALKYQQLLSYLIFGVLTTLVNLLLYYPLWGFVEQMGLSPDWIKLLAQILVVILNYVFSKFMIFRK